MKVVYLNSDNNNKVIILNLLTMRFSTPILAKDLKKELTSFGIKVLMCKQNNQNAVLAIDADESNYSLFLRFCNLNNYAGVCGLDFRIKAHKNVGNIFKYKEVC